MWVVTTATLAGVAALSAGDVWAVGYYLIGSLEQTLVEHWDGTSWTIVSSPNVGTGNNQLNAVAAVSASDVVGCGVLRHGHCAPDVGGALERQRMERESQPQCGH